MYLVKKRKKYFVSDRAKIRIILKCLTVYFQFNRYFTLIENEEIYLVKQERGPFGHSSRFKQNRPSAARS